MKHLSLSVLFTLIALLTACSEEDPAQPQTEETNTTQTSPTLADPPAPGDEAIGTTDEEPIPEPVAEAVEETEVYTPIPAPAYDREWIVIGDVVRFGMQPVKSEFYRNDEPIQLLLYVENLTDREIEWLPFRPDPSVQMPQYVEDAGMDWRPTYDPYANLRVWVHRLRDPGPRETIGIPGSDVDLANYQPDSPIQLAPGQTWVTTLRIFPSRIDPEFQNRYITDDTKDIVWHQPLFRAGNFRVRMRYQARGFEAPPGQTRGETLAWWSDVWVQFAELDTYLLN